jgi:hypothetical protein
VGDGLSVASQNRREGDDVGHASRSAGLLRMEANRVRVSQSGLKTGGGVMMSGARGIIAKITLKGS